MIGLYCPVTGIQNYRYYLVLLLNGVLIYRGFFVILILKIKMRKYSKEFCENSLKINFMLENMKAHVLLTFIGSSGKNRNGTHGRDSLEVPPKD